MPTSVMVTVDGFDPGVFHHGLCQRFRQGRTAVADRSAGEVRSRSDVFFFERQHDAQLFLTDRTDGLDRDILVGACFDDVHGVVDAELCLTGSDQRQGIVSVGRELELHVQTFLGVISLFDGVVQEAVDGVGVPVEHDIDRFETISRLRVGLRVRRGGCAAAAGECEQR